eukprot:m.184876 g.184876  ORF g.184876 m.184876 type:complete len:1082 (-) comp16257_c0_seq1:103-3348(-)
MSGWTQLPPRHVPTGGRQREARYLHAVEKFLTFLLFVSVAVLIWSLSFYDRVTLWRTISTQLTAIPRAGSKVLGTLGLSSYTPPAQINEQEQIPHSHPATSFGDCRDRTSANPATGPYGGFGETIPRQVVTASYDQVAQQHTVQDVDALSAVGGHEWKRQAVETGKAFLRVVDATHRAKDGIDSHLKTAIENRIPQSDMAAGGDCRNVSIKLLVEVAEVALEASVESRLWACITVRHALGHDIVNDDLALAVGFERLWHSPEYRALLREFSRRNLARSGGMCTRGFGSDHYRYIAAGVWGVTYARCVSGLGCDEMPNAVLKLAGLPSDTQWRDDTTGKLYKLGHASLAAGFDLSVESYMNEAVRMLVMYGVTPHIIIGYGTWICDDFSAEKEPGVFPMTGLYPNECKKKYKTPNQAKVSKKEFTSVCENILNEVRSGDQSKNLPVMAQEEVLLGVKDAIVSMNETLGKNQDVWHQAMAALLFEITYTVVALQRHFPAFRHNDLSWYNIRATAPWYINVTVEDKYSGEETTKRGTMFAPRDQLGYAVTYTEYTTANGTRFRIPNYGYSARIADWDFANAHTPRLHNAKINYKYSKRCGTNVTQDRLWTPPVRIVASNVVERKEMATESPTRKPFPVGNTCKQWAEARCDREDFVAAEYTPKEKRAVLTTCPKACMYEQGTVDLTIDTPTFATTESEADDADYKDNKGNKCTSWGGKCDKMHCESGFDLNDERELFAHCPVSCACTKQPTTQTVNGKPMYVVQIQQVSGLPDGIYRVSRVLGTGGQDATAADTWKLRVVVAHRHGVNLTAVAGAGAGTVQFLRRPWQSNFTLISKHEKNDYQQNVFQVKVDKSAFFTERYERGDILYIFDNTVGHPIEYRVHTVSSAKTVAANGVAILELNSRTQNGHRPGKGEAFGGGMFRLARACVDDFYDYSKYGITPVENTKFDLFFLYNQITDYTHEPGWRPYFPNKMKVLLNNLFNDVPRNLKGWYKPNVDDYRMTGNYFYWWCDRKGEWGTDEPISAGFPTAEGIMYSPLFAPFRVEGNPSSGVPIAKYSHNAPMPEAFCVGTGELPISSTSDKPA